MNIKRRKQLAKAIELIEQAQSIIDFVLEEEQEAYNNMPEQLQECERGERMYEAIDSLENLDTDFEDLKDNIQEIIDA